MGLFDNLIKEKFCDICGEKIKLLGNRKLSDGNLCKKCASKLSPWFSDRRESTVEEIRAQLSYREDNARAFAGFVPTKVLGDNFSVQIDGPGRRFVVIPGWVKNAAEYNPDIISFDDVQMVDTKVQTTTTEEKEKRGDEEVSYNPRRYVDSHSFNMRIVVNSPYFNELNFTLNSSPVKVRRRERRAPNTAGMTAKQALVAGVMNRKGYSCPEEEQDMVRYDSYAELAEEIKRSIFNVPAAEEESTARPGVPGEDKMTGDPALDEKIAKMKEYMAMSEEERQQYYAKVLAEAQAAAAAAGISVPQSEKVCPWCGDKVIPNADGTCPKCGGPMD